jgi:trigger factor
MRRSRTLIEEVKSMQITEKLSEGLKRELQVVVPATDLDARLSERLDQLKNQVQIKGFRPGKVPVAHLRRVYGRSVMAEIIQQTVSETSQKVLEERNEKPAFQPQIALTEDEKEIAELMEGKGDLAYSLSFEIMPAFEVADISNIELTREVVEVADEEVDKAVRQIADRNRPFEPKDDGAKAADGDRVTIDFKGSIDGEPFEGGSDEESDLVLGSASFIPGFEEQLIGTKAGDQVTVKVTFPDDYPAAHLAGKDAEFEVTVKAVAAPGELTIDDAFAQGMGLESLDQLKDAVRGQMAGELAQYSRRKIKRELLDKLDELHSFELPPTLVDQEFEGIWTQLTSDMEKADKTFADEDTTEEEARAEYRTLAERRVRLGLVLAEIGEKASVTVTDEEVNRALMDQARQFPGQEEQVWEYYRQNPQALAGLRAPIFEEKVVDHIVETAKVTDKPVDRQQLLRDPDEDGDEDAAPAKKAAKKAPAKKKAAPKKAAAKTADEATDATGGDA